MGEQLKKLISEILSGVIDPQVGKDIMTLNMVSFIDVQDGGKVTIVIEADPERGTALETLRQEAERKLRGLKGVSHVNAILTAQKAVPSQGVKPLPPKSMPAKPANNEPIPVTAKNIIVVASGKGGVGKSTVAANIAVSLAQFGGDTPLRVGLLDADIYGPSQPVMMGDVGYKPKLNEEKKLIPLNKHGIKMISIGFIAAQDQALIWRGPMVQTAFFQLVRDVAWEENGKPLDYLVIDLPPGTGDVQLTMAQRLRVDGAVIVSTPQDIALIDARRAVSMFNKTGVRVLGLVENMSSYICTNCGHEEHIFGEHGARDEAKKMGIDFLGEVPLSKDVRAQADAGTPIVLADPRSKGAQAFMSIADNIYKHSNK